MYELSKNISSSDVCELKTESSEDDEDDKEMLEQSLNNITRLKVLNQIEEQSDCEWYLLEHPEDFLNEKIMLTITNVIWANFVSHTIIDEALCVMQWGNDVFRPKYRKLLST